MLNKIRKVLGLGQVHHVTRVAGEPIEIDPEVKGKLHVW